MKKKGFTLIELLAVLTIFSIICLLAVPLILNQVKNNQKQISETQKEIIFHAAYLYSEENLKPNQTSCVLIQELIDADLLDEPVQDLETGTTLEPDRYVKIVTDNKKKANYELLKQGESCTASIKYPKYDNGTVIYFNPETNQKCSSSEAKSTTGTKTGCMKWHAFNDSENSSTVNVILDHNTTAKVAWNSSGSNSQMKEVKTVLNSDTATWNSSLNPRLIGANEIAKITGNTGFDANVAGKDNWFYFETNKQNDPSIAQGKAKYKWLFNYTQGCTSWGCDVNDSSTMGYWTSSPILSVANNAWYVRYAGRLYYSEVKNNNYYGVRPVISISKSVL